VTFGPQLHVAALDLGRVHGTIKAADARAGQSLASYELTVITALETTEDAFGGLLGAKQTRNDFLEASAASEQQASDLAHQRYESRRVGLSQRARCRAHPAGGANRLAASQTQPARHWVGRLQSARAGGKSATSNNPTEQKIRKQ